MRRAWDTSGSYARVGSPPPLKDSAVDGSQWRELNRAALLELDLDKMGERVKAAEKAIHARAALNGDILADERIAMQDARAALNISKAGIEQTNPRI